MPGPAKRGRAFYEAISLATFYETINFAMAEGQEKAEIWEVQTKGPEQTLCLGRTFGEMLSPGQVVALTGDLGAGKTVLAKGIARGLGVEDEREVTSPSFVMINEYKGRLPIFHVDLYRLAEASQVEGLGWEEIIFGPGVTLIEWPEKVWDLLPEERLEVYLCWLGPEERSFIFQAKGQTGKDLICRLREKWKKGD